MDLGKLKKFRSWLISAGIAVLITLWLASGQFGEEAPEEISTRVVTTTVPAQHVITSYSIHYTKLYDCASPNDVARPRSFH